MNESARLAAVILRLVAAGMIVTGGIAIVLQVGMVLVNANLQQEHAIAMLVQLLLGGLLVLVPGIWLYRNSRALGERLTRGLE
jgi:hypothetical protein